MADTMNAAARNWSTEQEAIFAYFAKTSTTVDVDGNLVVEALAGTGKTTTIIEGVNRAPERAILLCAFNKRIAEELTARLSNQNAIAKTLHAVGFSCVLRAWRGVKVERPSGNVLSRAEQLSRDVCGAMAPEFIVKMIGRLHTKGREIAPFAKTGNDLLDLAVQFECEPEEDWAIKGFTTEYVCARAVEAMELAAKVQPVNGIDFADMLFLPVRNGWTNPIYDLIVVDETQDMTMTQLILAQGMLRRGGRICIVGDPNQAIYAFRGADSQSMSRLFVELKADKLTLTTTYRCGRAIVAEAQQFVPHFRAGQNNPDGSVTSLQLGKLVETAAHGDFILSRLNAPLVSVAMSLLMSGKRARIAGRDIGAGLKALIRKLSKGRASNSVPELLAKIAAWETKEVDRMLRANREERVELIHDQAEMLVSLCAGARSVDDVNAKIDSLFTDDGLGAAGVITCSSVHRAKGLEADRVFVLRDTLRSNNQEELNIHYVAVTRAKSELVYVSEKRAA